MEELELERWKKLEQGLLTTEWELRAPLWTLASPPPEPSLFGFTRVHKSRAIAERVIDTCRRWFAVHMGFISYLIARAETIVPFKSLDVPPAWYERLVQQGFSHRWVNALLSTSISSFESHVLRNGVILNLLNKERNQPSIDWFIERSIPVYLTWSRFEEDAAPSNPELRPYSPPKSLVEKALAGLFENPDHEDVPIAAVVFRNYYGYGLEDLNIESFNLLQVRYASSIVMDYVRKRFLHEFDLLEQLGSSLPDAIRNFLAEDNASVRAAAEKAANFFHPVVEKGKPEDQVFNHWSDFLTFREIREKHLLRDETEDRANRRKQREKNPPTKNTKVFEWDKVISPSGHILYVRSLIDKGRNDSKIRCYNSSQAKYSAYFNEWDLCREFGGGEAGFVPFDFDDSDDSDDEYPLRPLDANGDQGDFSMATPAPLSSQTPTQPPIPSPRPHSPSLSPHPPSTIGPSSSTSSTRPHSPTLPPHPPSTISFPRPSSPTSPTRPNATSQDNYELPAESYFSDNLLECAYMVYGFTYSLEDSTADPPETDVLKKTLKSMGFIRNIAAHVSPSDLASVVSMMKHLSCWKEKDGSLQHNFDNIPYYLDDLNDRNARALSVFADFDPQQFEILSSTPPLYVFHGPRPSFCRWSLAVQSAAAALYVFRYFISLPGGRDLFTAAYHLSLRGIPFRTLVLLSGDLENRSLAKSYRPTFFFKNDHKFSDLDFKASLCRVRTILEVSSGRAAILRGGIVSRIAQEVLSPDGVLDGPSREVLKNQRGFVVASSIKGFNYWDDELTDEELKMICGACTMYTGKLQISSCKTLMTLR